MHNTRLPVMFSTTFIGASMALFSMAFTVALPPVVHQVGRAVSMNTPTSAPVVYYQATNLATSTTCGLKVAENTLDTNKCYTMYTAALGIQQHENRDCIFTIWDNVNDCSDNSTIDIPVPMGNSTICINDNVLDGGKFQHKSGMYLCN